MAKLIDITGKALSGEWGKDDENGEGIPVIRTTNFTNEGIVNYNNVVKRKIEKKNIDEKYLRKGDIIIEKSGGSDKFPVGRVVYFDGDENTYLFNNFTGLLRVKNQDVWYPKYVFYSLFSNYKRGGTRNFENKTTGLHNLKIDDYVSRYEISNINKEEQIYICKTLDSLYGIIKSRELEIQLLDELVKARFVEMFITKTYPTVKLDNLIMGKGEYGAQSAAIEYNPCRPRYVRITDINDDGTLNDDVVSSDNIEDDEQYKLTYGDFLFARMGATVGKTYAYKEGKQIFAGYLIRYKLNLKKIIPEYLYVYTKLDEYANWVELNKSGAAQPGINAKKYGALKIPIAPIEEQLEFRDFVNQVDKSKVVVFNYIKNVAILLTICSIINENTNGKMGRRLYDN